MKRSTLRNIAGTVMWFFAGMFLWEYAIKLMVEREERQSRDGGFPVETDDIRRYSDAIYAGMIFDIILFAAGLILLMRKAWS
jgi:hypothetical protein